jgi:hypothetical protein
VDTMLHILIFPGYLLAEAWVLVYTMRK